MLRTLIPNNGISLCLRINDSRKDLKKQSWYHSKSRILFLQQQNPNKNVSVNKYWRRLKPSHILNPEEIEIAPQHVDKSGVFEKENGTLQKGFQQMLVLCGFGYWVNGFRWFPWLGLNFHMANNLSMEPSTLQLVQNIGNLPMVAKPLYGILSDALYIGGAHRIPYISIGVFIQSLSWGLLALIPVAREALPFLLACVLLGNLGASISEVAKDALVAEYGQKNKIPALQSYAFTAAATGGVLGNLLGSFFLLRAKQPMPMFLTFASLLALQLATTVMTKEESLGLPQTSSSSIAQETILESIRKQCADLLVVVKQENIFHPLMWIITSIVMVPVLSGSVFCYQTQCLNLDPSVIGMSKVTGQLILFVLTVLYDRFWRKLPLRKLVGVLQIVYVSTIILDLILVKQVNLTLGIPNESFVFCFSAVAETLAHFKLLPFHVLFANLAPAGCEGSLMSFFTSALCLSSIASGFLGVGLASVLGVTSGDYSNLPIGICIQFLAALLPLLWINLVPDKETAAEKGTKLRRSKRNRRNRSGRRLAFDPIHHPYRQERAPDFWR